MSEQIKPNHNQEEYISAMAYWKDISVRQNDNVDKNTFLELFFENYELIVRLILSPTGYFILDQVFISEDAQNYGEVTSEKGISTRIINIPNIPCSKKWIEAHYYLAHHGEKHIVDIMENILSCIVLKSKSDFNIIHPKMNN